MKQNHLFLALIALTILLLSCGKEKVASETPNEDQQEIPDINAGRLKSYTKVFKSSNGSTTFTYHLSYDDKNRISAITVPEDPKFIILFKYHSTDSYSREERRDGVITEKTDYYLKYSRLDSVTVFHKINDTTTGKYHYDDKNLLNRVDYYSYYSGPNHFLTENYNYDATGKLTSYTNGINDFLFEYYPDLVYDLPVTEPIFPGPKKSNLLRRKILTGRGAVITDVTTTYTFDNKKRIFSKTETAINGETTTYTYTYL